MRVQAHHLLTHRGIVVAAFAATLVLLVLAFVAPAALAAPGNGSTAVKAGSTPGLTGVDVSQNNDDIVRAGGNVFIAPGQTVESVTVFGGDAVVAGTVRHSVVAVGGDVVLKNSARVGTRIAPEDAAVFAIGGTTTIAPGAIVTGTTGAWEDVSSGEALVAGAIAMTGMIIGGTILAAIAFAVLALGTMLGIAMLAGLVWLIVWLARRDNRKRDAMNPGPATGVGYAQGDGYVQGPGYGQVTDVAQAQTEAQTEAQTGAQTQAALTYPGPTFTVPPATA